MIDQAKALVPDIKNIVDLGNQYNVARSNFNNRTKDMDTFEQMKLYYKDPEVQDARNKLVHYLDQFSKEQVAIIRAIMYVGREDNNLIAIREEKEDSDRKHDPEYRALRRRAFGLTVTLLKQSFANVSNDSKEVAIDHMIEKTSFAKNLALGLKVLKLEMR